MIKKILCLIMGILLCLTLSGCWSYRDLDTLDIVSGMAVDKDLDSGEYLLTLEIIDTESAGEGTLNARYVEAKGETLFDAIRNSKRRLINKLYGGNMQTMVISHQIAKEVGVDAILEEMMRDGEPRETMSVAISQEETAREILLTDGVDSKIIAYELHDMIVEDNAVTASTKNVPLYKAYNAIHGDGNILVLPAIHCVKNNDETVAESNGIGFFRGDRLIQFESPKNTMLYLFVVDDVSGGVLSFPVTAQDELISLEIKGSNTKTDVVIQGGQLHVLIKIAVKLNVTEIKAQVDLNDFHQRIQLEELTAQVLQNRVSDYFKHVQTDIQMDVFGLGRKLYQKNAALWDAVANDWDMYFQNAAVQVQVKADILTSGVLKRY